MSAPGRRTRGVTKSAERSIGGVTFVDPYAWLHEDSERSLDWQWSADAVAQKEVRSWPQFGQLRDEILAAGAGYTSDLFNRSAPRLRGKWWFSLAKAPSSGNALWISTSLDQPGHVLVTAQELLGDGIQGGALIYWFEPSPGGEYVAACVTSAGSMLGVWRVVDVHNRRVLEVELPATAYTGALPGWMPDASGMFLCDRAPNRCHRLVFVPVGSDAAPRAEVIFDHSEVSPDISGLTPEVSPDGRWVIALSGPHERIACALGDLHTGEWRPFLPEGYRGECSGAWLDADTYVARVHGELTPRGRVVAIPCATSRDTSTWRELVPQSESVLRAVTVVRSRLVVAEVHEVSARFRLFDLDGENQTIVPLGGPGTNIIAFLIRRFDSSDELTLGYETFTRQSTIYHCDVETARLRTLGRRGQEQLGITVSQRFATSLDGTRVPYFLVHSESVDISHPQPVLLTGYGGFNMAFLPMYLSHLIPFVRAGGVVAHANLRGGSEYGRDWHEAGRLACKWNTFLDLFAVAEHLISQKVATSDRLAMVGASNGGLLAGAAIVHRPDLFRVVVPIVPILDQMEPLPTDPAFDPIRAIFRQDYGDPSHPEMSKILFSYSPYHNIKDGVTYPSVLLVFGENDISCMPFHGRKFCARLQAATTSKGPVLLRVWRNTGHGVLGDEVPAAEQAAEWLSFVMRELDMKLSGNERP